MPGCQDNNDCPDQYAEQAFPPPIDGFTVFEFCDARPLRGSEIRGLESPAL